MILRAKTARIAMAAAVVVAAGFAFIQNREYNSRFERIPAGASLKEVYALAGRPMIVLPYDVHDWPREYVWVYPGPLRFAPAFSLSPFHVALFKRDCGPCIRFNQAGKVQWID